MRSRPRYRLHAALDLARRFATEPEPTGGLAQREGLFPNCPSSLAAFLAWPPVVRRRWVTDLRVAYTRHPEAVSGSAHDLHGLGAPLIPQMIAEHSYSITGIGFHPAYDESTDISERISKDQK